MIESLDAERYPDLVEFATAQIVDGNYDFADEFDFGLQLILDGFEQLLG